MERDECFKRGFENRKTVLGAAHVEKSWANADDFNRPMQKLVTESCNIRVGSDLAEMAVFFSATGDKLSALAWLTRSAGQGYDVTLIKPVFHTPEDIEAEKLYTEGIAAYKAKKWSEASNTLFKLLQDHAGSSIVIQVGYDEIDKIIKKCEETIAHEQETEKKEEETKKEEEGLNGDRLNMVRMVPVDADVESVF